MSKTKNILFTIVVLTIIIGCQTTNIPSAYNFKMSEIQQNPYGCWTSIDLKLEDSILNDNKISGELLAIVHDSIYLLVGDSNSVIIERELVKKATLVTHKNQSGTYAAISGLLILPNIIGLIAFAEPGFIILALPTLLIGGTLTIVESSGEGHLLVYPDKNTLAKFAEFARFPQGLPGSVDPNKLTLKKD